MPDTKITALAAITTVDPAADVLPIVDISDTSMAASGTTKKITSNQILGAGGTATLASATITGDLTVDTSTLKVDSTNNRVGIGTASPSVRMELSVADAAEGARLTASSAWLRLFPYLDATDKTKIQAVNGTNTALSDLTLEGLGLRFNTNAGLSYAISNASVHTWQNVGGVAGTAMTLNANGLGVGVVPYVSWPATSKALQLGASSSIEGRTNDGSRFAVYTNAVWNGTNLIYQNTAAASYYLQSSGVHSWYNAPSGTAGTTITDFATAKMTLDASGRLILLASTTTPATLATNGELTFTATSNTNLRFSYRGSDGVTRVANLTLA